MVRGIVARALCSSALAAAALVCLTSSAEERTRARITDIKFRSVRTPQFRDTSNTEASAKNEWLQVYVEYETAGGKDGWTDELTIEWTLLVRPGGVRPMILKQSVTYIDVEEGKHHAVVYVRPGFIKRWTGQKDPSKNDFAVYIEISASGNRIAREEFSRTRQPRNWWQAREPDVRIVEGELLPRSETPFANMDYDFYEHIKPTKR